MSIRSWCSIVVIGLLTVGLAACQQTGGDNAAGTAPENMPTAAEAGAATSGETAGSPAGDSVEATPMKPPERPTVMGTRRNVPVDEAASSVAFTLLEPSDLPEDTHRDVVHLEEPVEGETAPGLPAVRFIYTTVPHGAIVIYQSPATGEEAEGEPIDVAGHNGWIQEAEAGRSIVIEWEQDGTRIQLRGSDVDRAILLAAAKSMVPVKAPE